MAEIDNSYPCNFEAKKKTSCIKCGQEAEQFNEWDEPPVDWYHCNTCNVNFQVDREEQEGKDNG
jgi:DNA-directed RNA polymerase subunit RPC12/RpoP